MNTVKSILHKALTASQAMNKGCEQARYAQLATITLDEQPTCRTIVMREIMEDESIIACTDIRSRKIKELNARPFAELCMWFPISKEQYRIRCNVNIIDSNSSAQSTRERIWKSLSAPSRTQFEMMAPGTQLVKQSLSDLDKYEAQPPAVDCVSDNFALLVFAPIRVDYLYLPKAVVAIHPVSIEQYAESRGLKIWARDEKSQARWLLQRDKDNQWQITELQP